MTALAGRTEIRPGQRLAIRRYTIEHPLIDYAFGHAFTVEGVAIDEPHPESLTQTVRALRILVDILAVKLEPVFATVIGKNSFIAIVLWRVEKEGFGFDAAVHGSIDRCSRFFKAPLYFHDGIGFIKIDSPGANNRKPGR